MTREQAEVLHRVEAEMTLDTGKNKIIVSFPWNNRLDKMKSNYAQAKARQAGVEGRLRKVGRQAEYHQEMSKAIESGAVCKLSTEELSEWTGPCHYIVNFPVYKPGSGSTPLRIVANSALKNCHTGYSVNECMDVGPTTVASGPTG